MAIYTKRGDRGKTSLYDPKNRQDRRISKDSQTIGAIGAIDELNSYLGICISFCENPETTLTLKEIQANLFTIGSILAGSKLRFGSLKTKKLEKMIDKLEGELPVLKNFILPGGSKLASHLQFARALCRRAERKLVALSKLQSTSHLPRRQAGQLLSYMNRLSDFLFMLAREENHELGVKEVVWSK